MDLDSSETNLVIITNKAKLVIFYKLYWRVILFLATPLLLLPISLIGENNAYPCFYVFLVTAIYWTTDVAHPAVISLSALALSSIYGLFGIEMIASIHVTRTLLDCLGVMLLNVAVEYCNVHKRVALKIMLIFGCSHSRLSFLLFITATVASMWISDVLTCGLMIPLVRSVLIELEILGIIEVYETFDKETRNQRNHKPTVFTSFYFLGIAYSSSVGGMSTLFGSRTNQIFKTIYESTFPAGPKIEFPHIMLLNLPGVLLMVTLIYLWLNFYFLGMFRSYHGAPLQMRMTEEETEYMNALLTARHRQLGGLTFHEMVVSAAIVLTVILQIISNSLVTEHIIQGNIISHVKLLSPSIVCVVLLFLTPINLDFMRFFKRRTGNPSPLPTAPSKTSLSWELVTNSIPWSVLFVIGGSSTVFEALRTSKMTLEFENFLMLFSNWPTTALVLIAVVLCKTLTEFAGNSCVARALLPHMARVLVHCNGLFYYYFLVVGLCFWRSESFQEQRPDCVTSKIDPHYLMLAGTLSSSLPFHLMTGTPVNAMVLAYVHIPPGVMLRAGLVPSVISVVLIWFTVTTWSKTIWPEINQFPNWADVNVSAFVEL